MFKQCALPPPLSKPSLHMYAWLSKDKKRMKVDKRGKIWMGFGTLILMHGLFLLMQAF